MLKTPGPPASLPLDPVDTNVRLEERRNRFMQDPDVYEARKRRELFTVELRSKARSDHLYKRRLGSEPKSAEFVVSRALASAKPQLTHSDASLESKLVALKETMAGNSLSLRADALSCLRELSTDEQAQDLICAMDFVPLLKECLENTQSQIVQDSSFIFVSLTSGIPRVNEYLVTMGVAEALLRCVTAHNLKATENCLWALCNLMCDIPETRITLLNKNVVQLLQKVVDWYSLTEIDIVCTVAWCCSKLCKGVLSIPDAKGIVSLLKKVMASEDAEVLKDSMFALEKLMEGDAELVGQVLDQTIIDKVINGIQSSDKYTKTYAINIATSIAAESAEYTQHLLVCNLLTYLKPALSFDNPSVRASVLLCLGNISAWSNSMTSQLMAHEIVSAAVNALNDSAAEVREEALSFLEVLASHATLSQRLKLIFVYEVLRPFKVAMTLWNPENLPQICEICDLLLQAGSAEESMGGQTVLTMFEESGCYDQLSRILLSAEDESQNLYRLIDLYFTEKDEGALNMPVPESSFNFS